jgi:hypothetical protein
MVKLVVDVEVDVVATEQVAPVVVGIIHDRVDAALSKGLMDTGYDVTCRVDDWEVQ